MAYGVKIDGMSFIGHKFNGIEIIDVYRMPSGMWGAQVKCTCGKVFKTSLRQARGLCWCPHKKKRKRED